MGLIIVAIKIFKASLLVVSFEMLAAITVKKVYKKRSVNSKEIHNLIWLFI